MTSSAEYMREYYHNHKEELAEKRKSDTIHHKCECGGVYYQRNISKHKQTKKHKKWSILKDKL